LGYYKIESMNVWEIPKSKALGVRPTHLRRGLFERDNESL
jgi:hypothetical protein